MRAKDRVHYGAKHGGSTQGSSLSPQSYEGHGADDVGGGVANLGGRIRVDIGRQWYY